MPKRRKSFKSRLVAKCGLAGCVRKAQVIYTGLCLPCHVNIRHHTKKNATDLREWFRLSHLRVIRNDQMEIAVGLDGKLLTRWAQRSQ